MKKAAVISIIILISILFTFCSPVRTRYPYKKPLASQVEPEDSATDPAIPDVQPVKHRFSDTTVVILDSGTAAPAREQSSLLQEAIKEFDNENYNSACNKFRQIFSASQPGDSVYYESLFYTVECMILKDDIPGAETKLRAMLDAGDLHQSVLQKVLVRLGQVCCVLKKETEAKIYFDRLRESFPNSIYIPLADCSSVKPK